MFSTPRIPVSLEFFPPKTPEGADKLRLVRQQLYPLQPTFCSVTFGAGGSTQEGTFGTVRAILAEGVDAAIERAIACVEAGADGIFAEAAYDLPTYQKFVDAVKVPVLEAYVNPAVPASTPALLN